MSGYGLDEDSHLSTVLEKSLKLKNIDKNQIGREIFIKNWKSRDNV